MRILKASIAAMAVLGLASAASAANIPGNGGPLPSIEKQVMSQARADGVLKNMKSPKAEIKLSRSGKTALVTISAITRFGGPPTPLPVPTRLPMVEAKFRIGHVMEGQIATPVKSHGQVWEPIMRALTQSAGK
jgi:hypothetical protein